MKKVRFPRAVRSDCAWGQYKAREEAAWRSRHRVTTPAPFEARVAESYASPAAPFPAPDALTDDVDLGVKLIRACLVLVALEPFN